MKRTVHETVVTKWINEAFQKQKGLENVRIHISTRSEDMDIDGCNWSVSYLSVSEDTDRAILNLVFQTILGEARGQFNLI